MIFDNVEKIDTVVDFLPTSSGSILLTTRYPNVAHSAPGWQDSKLQLKSLSFDEGWDMFRGMLTGPRNLWPNQEISQEENAGRQLVEKLGGLPLGLRQMAALIRHKHMKVEVFLKWYKKEAGSSRIFSRGTDLKVDSNYSLYLETVWHMSFKELQDERERSSVDSFMLLATLCFLSPDEIPTEIFKHECSLLHFCGDEDLFE